MREKFTKEEIFEIIDNFFKNKKNVDFVDIFDLKKRFEGLIGLPKKKGLYKEYIISKERRQGLIITIEQLKKLANELEKEVKKNEEKYKISGWGTKFQINIINKEGLSDTWELEE